MTSLLLVLLAAMSAAILLLAGPLTWGVWMLAWLGFGILGRMS